MSSRTSIPNPGGFLEDGGIVGKIVTISPDQDKRRFNHRKVAKGMGFLRSKRYIHHYLAARNVLVTKNLVAKIADLGQPCNTHWQDYSQSIGGSRHPVKWMAPEALVQRRHMIQSDVWSFGILLWEIMTLGASPYPSVPTIEKLLQLLVDGHRMSCPQDCPIEVHDIMQDCWHADPVYRPTFSRLVADFDRILTLAPQNYLDKDFLSRPRLEL